MRSLHEVELGVVVYRQQRLKTFAVIPNQFTEDRNRDAPFGRQGRKVQPVAIASAVQFVAEDRAEAAAYDATGKPDRGVLIFDPTAAAI